MKWEAMMRNEGDEGDIWKTARDRGNEYKEIEWIIVRGVLKQKSLGY